MFIRHSISIANLQEAQPTFGATKEPREQRWHRYIERFIRPATPHTSADRPAGPLRQASTTHDCDENKSKAEIRVNNLWTITFSIYHARRSKTGLMWLWFITVYICIYSNVACVLYNINMVNASAFIFIFLYLDHTRATYYVGILYYFILRTCFILVLSWKHPFLSLGSMKHIRWLYVLYCFHLLPIVLTTNTSYYRPRTRTHSHFTHPNALVRCLTRIKESMAPHQHRIEYTIDYNVKELHQFANRALSTCRRNQSTLIRQRYRFTRAALGWARKQRGVVSASSALSPRGVRSTPIRQTAGVCEAPSRVWTPVDGRPEKKRRPRMHCNPGL